MATQKQRVLKHLLLGQTLTSWESIGRFGCTRLADIIYLLKKDGFPISKEMKKNAKGNGQYAVYTLIQKK